MCDEDDDQGGNEGAAGGLGVMVMMFDEGDRDDDEDVCWGRWEREAWPHEMGWLMMMDGWGVSGKVEEEAEDDDESDRGTWGRG